MEKKHEKVKINLKFGTCVAKSQRYLKNYCIVEHVPLQEENIRFG
jgi:hypothetical protein